MGTAPQGSKIGRNSPVEAKPVNFVKSAFSLALQRAIAPLSQTLRRSRILFVVALTAIALCGCVDYEVGIHFDHQTHGEIVQHIDLSRRFANLSSDNVRQWTDSLNRRARSLQGYTKKQGDRSLLVVLPFNNGDELAEKFEQFFNPVDNRAVAPEKAGQIPELETHLDLTQRNFVFALSNHLTLDTDLRALGVLSSEGNLLVSSGGLVDLQFRIETPWGASVADYDGSTAPTLKDNALIWPLQPGEIQHLEVDFWLPSPIGIGAAVIVLVVSLASYLKHQLLPALGIGKKDNPPQPQTSQG